MNPNQLQNQNRIKETSQPRKISRRTLLTMGGGAAVVALGSAGCQTVAQPTPQAKANEGQIVVQGGGQGGGARVKQTTPKIKPAAELPAGAPDVIGLYLSRQDNSVFVGTGEIEWAAGFDKAGKKGLTAKHNGSDVEVVVTRDTQFYEDKTPITQKDVDEQKEVQQIIAPVASLDDLVSKLTNNDSLLVWGQKSGDRFIAKTIVYRPPYWQSSPGLRQ